MAFRRLRTVMIVVGLNVDLQHASRLIKDTPRRRNNYGNGLED